MFAVKSEYCVQPSRDITIPFYVAGDKLFFKFADISKEMYGALFGYVMTYSFNNYEGYFVKQIDLFNLFKDKPEKFVHRDFWHEIVNQDYSRIIAEVRNAQQFVKDYFSLDLPKDWSFLPVDTILDTLFTRTSDWIEKCHNSLRILATNDEQQKTARRVYDEAWKILKSREKAKANDDKRTTVHNVLNKFGLTDDDLIQAILDAHETKFAKEQSKRKADFDNQHIYLENELRRILK